MRPLYTMLYLIVMRYSSCAGLLEGLRQAVPLVEPVCEAAGSRRSSHAAPCMQRPASMPSAHLPPRSPSEEELGRGRHAAWQELPPELIALILCRASVRERKLCEPPLFGAITSSMLTAACGGTLTMLSSPHTALLRRSSAAGAILHGKNFRWSSRPSH